MLLIITLLVATLNNNVVVVARFFRFVLYPSLCEIGKFETALIVYTNFRLLTLTL